MTAAELATLLAGIDVDSGRRRPRYARPIAPARDFEKIGTTHEYAKS
ncbi:hypothetical protein SAMN05444166_5470 [Singulisphaera sp. GP187]|nr:hypothetical protein [Singulisphaera sp. GP187]SIO57715.1 hypothetical protein SAMN05444166_5470 [Singulisphaera sp. GP187]